jgi:hypothetical protein
VITALEIINDIRRQIAAQDDALSGARSRRDAVFAAAATFPGVLRTFRSGSLATGYINHPVDDADGGMVLDRRAYPSLGPDGGGELPHSTVEDIQNHIRPILREKYPKVSVVKMKRGLLIEVNEPLAFEQDPTVDLVIALNRATDDALWIPNLDQNRWDPSHPERHVALFTSGSSELRRTRAQVVRLGKAQVKQFKRPTLSSFNVSALAWEEVQKAESLDEALLRFLDYAATEIADHPTDDPAGVSAPISLPEGLQRETIVIRLERAADALERAIAAGDNEAKVLAALADVFPNYVQAPDTPSERNLLARALRSGAPVLLPLGVRPTPATRSHGGRHGQR